MSKPTVAPLSPLIADIPIPPSITEAQCAFAQAVGQALAAAWLKHVRSLATPQNARKRRSNSTRRCQKPDRNSHGN